MPYQMPNGKWRAKRMIQGVIRTKVFTTKQEAKKWEATQEAAAWAEQSPQTPTTCFLEIANAYLSMAAERYAAKTLSEKRLAFKSLFKTIDATTTPEEVTPAVAYEALRLVARSSSGNAANKARKNLLSAWEWGKKYYGLPTINPFKEVEKFPADKRPRYVPAESDFWKAYEAAADHDKVFLLMLLHTGARMSEVYRLKWDDIDFVNRKARFGTRKTGHGGMEYAWVPMTSVLHSALSGHRTKSRSIFVFTDPETGRPYTARQHYMIRLCKRAKVKPFGFHAVRHLAATIMAHEGMQIPEVQAVLRHKNPNTTSRYIKSLGVNPSKLDEIFKKRGGPKVIPFEPPKKAFGT